VQPVVVGAHRPWLPEHTCPGNGTTVIDGDGQLLPGVAVVPGAVVEPPAS